VSGNGGLSVCILLLKIFLSGFFGSRAGNGLAWPQFAVRTLADHFFMRMESKQNWES
jgi:hypothetical protein